MATNISHFLDVSTYFVLVYPWMKPVLLINKERYQAIATPASHHGTLWTWFVQRFVFFCLEKKNFCSCDKGWVRISKAEFGFASRSAILLELKHVPQYLLPSINLSHGYVCFQLGWKFLLQFFFPSSDNLSSVEECNSGWGLSGAFGMPWSITCHSTFSFP